MTGRLTQLAAGAAMALASLAVATLARAESQVERGRYLAAIMDCGGCHTTGSLVGKPEPTGYLAGSDIGWAMPGIGVVYPRNITSDKETGIGSWSSDDIVRLLKTGRRPDGREVAPIMNWRSYSNLTDADVHALAAYLRSVPAVRHPTSGPVPMAEVKTPFITISKP